MGNSDKYMKWRTAVFRRAHDVRTSVLENWVLSKYKTRHIKHNIISGTYLIDKALASGVALNCGTLVSACSAEVQEDLENDRWHCRRSIIESKVKRECELPYLSMEWY
jgi:hypothetical protein